MYYFFFAIDFCVGAHNLQECISFAVLTVCAVCSKTTVGAIELNSIDLDAVRHPAPSGQILFRKKKKIK